MSNYIVRNDRIKLNAIAEIERIVVDETHPMDVIIKKHVNSKTVEQRKGFHWLCGALGEEIDMTAGEVKEIAKAQLFGWKTVSYAGIELVVADGRSEKLNIKEYSSLIEILYRMGGEAGVVLPALVRA